MARTQAKSRKADAIGPVEKKLLNFAEDLGRVLGAAEAKAHVWLNQRKSVVEQLSAIRDKANGLITTLSGEAAGRGRRAAARPAAKTAVRTVKRAKRKLSAAARKAISDAQKARWAKHRAAKG